MVAHDDIRAGTDMCVCESVCACSQSLQVMLMVRVWTVFQCCTGVGGGGGGGGECIQGKKCMHAGEESLGAAPDPGSTPSVPGFGSDI